MLRGPIASVVQESTLQEVGPLELNNSTRLLRGRRGRKNGVCSPAPLETLGLRPYSWIQSNGQASRIGIQYCACTQHVPSDLDYLISLQGYRHFRRAKSRGTYTIYTYLLRPWLPFVSFHGAPGSKVSFRPEISEIRENGSLGFALSPVANAEIPAAVLSHQIPPPECENPILASPEVMTSHPSVTPSEV